MNIFRAFMELDSINEAYYSDRALLIDNIKKLGRNYNFDKYSDAQLYRIWQKIKNEQDKEQEIPITNDDYSVDKKPVCDKCGVRLTDGGYCPVCDDGDEDLLEDVFSDFTSMPRTTNWIKMPPSTSAGSSTGTSATSGVTTSNANNTTAQSVTQSNYAGKYVVTIVYDGSKLRAQANDGLHGKAWVAFPNNLRTHAGQQYVVDDLTWNGKNYRAIGSITAI